jgi:phosphoserine aminotransferase
MQFQLVELYIFILAAVVGYHIIHRSVGGCRASCYSALPLTSAQALASFMEEFAKANP